jgi:hypothetical protein
VNHAKLWAKSLSVLGLIIASPLIVSAQTGFGDDLVLSTTAGCFSICNGSTNVKGVQGNVTLTNAVTSNFPLTVSVKVQCNGSDVAGATQNLGNVTLSPLGTTVLPYSITFTPVAGCAYTVVTTATHQTNGRFETRSTAFTANCMDQPCGTAGCTLTQGYWKNHPEDWPVATLTLGTASYTKDQLLSILAQPVKGNGLVSLAHQLIAAKLNVANGATCTAITGTIAKADAVIAGSVVPPVGAGSLSTSSVSALVSALDEFNNGLTSGCPGHCSE